jgi:predicted porin
VTLLSAGTVAAESADSEPVDSLSLQAAVERVREIAGELRPHVVDLESREDPPQAEELQQVQPYVERLTAAIREVEEQLAATGADEVPDALGAARKLLRRIAALDLHRRAADLRTRVDQLLARPEPPSEAEIDELRRLRVELQATLIELTAEARGAVPGPAAAPDEVSASALAESIEALAGADPVGLRRARDILVPLLVMQVEVNGAVLRPDVERLESKLEPPTIEELQALLPVVERLRAAVDALERDLEDAVVREVPSALASGVDLLRRYANLGLASSLAELTPVVGTCEAQQEPLTSEQIEQLRKIPQELRPRLRSARRTTRWQDGLTEDEVHSPEIDAAADLLQRVTRLVPDSPLAQEEPVDAPQTQPVTRFYRFYGSLRLRAVAREGRGVEIDGQTSRIGVRLEGPLTKKVTGLARAEMGFNFFDIDALRDLEEGRGLDVGSLLFHRLSFIGARFGRNEIRFGKQWGAFYDVGVFADQMPYFAGEGTGVFAARSDGGIAGTGRADQALQFSNVIDAFRYTLQMQIRNETDNDRSLADTFGASLTWEMNDRMQIGSAYNEVRDGIADPEIGEPKEGDRALIVGYRYQTDPLYLGTTLSLFDNHDTDDQGVFFGGLGVEAYGSYQLTRKLMVRAALSTLLPDSDYPGEYRVLTFTSGLNYSLIDKLSLVLLTRLDFSRLADGSDRDGDVLSLALFFNF